MLSSCLDERFHQLPYQLLDVLYHFRLPPETIGIKLATIKALRPMAIIADVIDFLECYRADPEIHTGLVFRRPNLSQGGFFLAEEILDQLDQLIAARCRELGMYHLLDRLPHYRLPVGSGTVAYCYTSHLHAVLFPDLDDMED